MPKRGQDTRIPDVRREGSGAAAPGRAAARKAQSFSPCDGRLTLSGVISPGSTVTSVENGA